MWLLLLVYLWPLISPHRTIVPYDVLYGMEPWSSEANDVKSAQNISGVWNINSIDALFYTIPVAEATKRQLKSGRLPLWDTNTLTGFPLGAFFSAYPINILALGFLSSENTLRVETVFHLLILSLFAYLLVVSLDCHPMAGVLAGVVAAINAGMIFYLIAPLHLPAVAWTLGPFWCFSRFKRERNWKWTIAGGLCYGLLASTPNAQWLLYTSLVYGGYVLCWVGIEFWRRALRQAVAHLLHSLGMVVIGVLIGLPALVMIFLFKSGIDRAPLVFPKIRFLTWIWILVPYYWGDVLPHFNLLPAIPLQARVYVGIIPLTLAITAALFSNKAESRIFITLALFLIAVTLGLPPFTNLFYLFMPNVYLDHTRVLVLSSLLIAVCAGFGLDALLRFQRARIFSAFVLGGIIVFLAVIRHGASDGSPVKVVRMKSIATSMVFALVGLLLVLVMMWGRERVVKLGTLALLALVAFDLFSTFWRYQAVFPSGLMQATPTLRELSKLVNAHEPRSRVYYVEGDVWGLRPQVLNYFDIPQITGYTNLPNSRYNLYTFASGARGYDGQMWRWWMDVREPRSNLLDALGGEYVLVPRVKLIAGDSRVPLLPDQQRQPLVINGTQLQALPTTSEAIRTSLQIPKTGRSFLLTGIALPQGSVNYQLNVNGVSVDSGWMSKQSDLPFWKPLSVNLTPFAGQSVEISFQAKAGQDSSYQWIDPVLHLNPEGSDLILIDSNGLLLYQNTKAFPRTWLVHNVQCVPSNDINTALSVLTNGSTDVQKLGRLHEGVPIASLTSTNRSVDLRQTAVVESDAPISLGAPHPSDQAAIIGYEPTKVKIKVRTREQGFVVLPDVYHPTWRAVVDRTPTVLYATNVAMRGVVVPPGEHIVEFYYNETPVKLAIAVAVLTAVACLVLLVLKGWRGAMHNKATTIPGKMSR